MTRIRTLAVAVLLAASTYGIVRGSAPLQTGTWGSVGPIADPRSGAAAVSLADGRTLVAGGTVAGGTATDTVVVYDPSANSFTSVGRLIAARVGHTATLLADGRVLVSGGTIDNAISSDIELFNPASGTSVLVGTLSRPRTGHAAARLSDGTVLIVGGSSTDGVVLQSAELFNPANSSVASVPSNLNQRRTGASATTLIDGRVLVAGGRDGSNDLASAELFYPSTQSFSTVDTVLSVPRSGHTALLLPHNAGVLLAGGSANGVAVATSDLFLPAIFPDPFSWGVGQFAPTGAMTAPRSRAVSGPASEGYAFASGGGAGVAEHYRFATIKTNKDDYAPGERAVITGSGWQAGEEVTLLFQEDPAVHEDYVLKVVAKADGTIYWDQWAPEEHDLNVRFYLTASDSRSRAQTTFTDGRRIDVSVSAPGSSADITYRVFSSNDCSGTVTPTTVTLAHGAILTVATLLTSQQTVQVTAGATAANGVPFAEWTVVATDGNADPIPLNLSQATLCVPGQGGAQNNNQGTYVYTANYAYPKISVTVSPTSVVEDGAQNLVYQFARTGLTSSPLTISFSVGGTAAFGTDYSQTGAASFSSSAGTVTFATGSATASITIDPATDALSEPDETVILTVVSGTGYTVGTPSSATGTITNDDQNAPPIVDAGADATINEGSAFTQNGSFTDADTDTWTATVNYGDGSGEQPLTLTGKTFTLSHTYTDNGSYTVTVKVKDDDNAEGSDTVTVTVNNVTPVVNGGADATINEGATFTQGGSFTDPGADTWTATVNYGDGSGDQSLTLSGKTFTLSHTYTDNGSYTVTVKVKDDDNAEGSDTVTVTVNNVTPVVNAGADATINEGSTFTQGGSFTDPGADTWTATVNYGDGSGDQPLTLTGKTFTLSHTYTDNGSYTVTVKVKDDDNAEGSDTVTVTVNNVTPVVNAGADATINEGSTFTQGGSFTDPGADTWTATVNYGDGSGDQPLTLTGKTFTLSHTYIDNGSFTVTVKVKDDDNAEGSDTVIVTVYNVAPTATPAAASPISEGGSSTLSLTGPFDPGAADTTAGFRYSFACDGLNSTLATTYAAASTVNSTSCTFNNNGSFTVKLRILDKDSGYSTYEATVVVTNVAPVLDSLGTSHFTAPIGTTITLDADYSDAGILDTHKCYVNWDDLTPEEEVVGVKDSVDPSLGSCAPFRQFTAQGVYSITVYVKDNDGGKSNTMTVMVTIFDPNGGFVTGGGWIMSPAGAYVADYSLTGKANFGFVSKYKKGSSIPEGQTEFQFKAGDLNFHSSAYEYGSLVVSNFRAQYKGTGTINGVSGFKFILTAYDGQALGGDGIDKFRIKIMTMADVIVYDNALGASDDIDTANPTAIGGGSVVIHSPAGKK